MQVKRKDVVDLFIAMGYHTAGKWDSVKIKSKIKQLRILLSDKDVKLTAEQRVFAEELVSNENNIDLLTKKDTKVASTNGKKEVKKEGKDVEKKTKKKANGTKSTKPKEKKGKDSFGSRSGSIIAKFNSAITKQPKSMVDLLKESGVKLTMYNHINRLIKKGLVVKSKSGKTALYALA